MHRCSKLPSHLCPAPYLTAAPAVAEGGPAPPLVSVGLKPRQAWEAEGAMAAGENHLACREELVPGDGRHEAQRTWLSALGSPGLSTVRPCKSQLVATTPGRTAPGGERALAWARAEIG